MAKKKKASGRPVLPTQFQTPAPGKVVQDQESPYTALAAHLDSLLRKWDNVRREEIIPTWRKAWRNFNSIDDGDENDASQKQNRGKKTWRSQAFYPLTEQKVTAATAQIDDVLFRGGSFPYDMKPSPISDAGMAAASFDETLQVSEEDKRLDMEQKIAATKLRMMKRKVDDQLAEGDAVVEARVAVHSAALYGCTFLETPLTVTRVRNIWKAAKNGSFRNTRIEEDAPTFRTLDNWDCWPDPDCNGEVQRGRGFFHRESKSLSDLIFLYDQVFAAEGKKDSYEYDYLKSEFDALLEMCKADPKSKTESRQFQDRPEDRPWVDRSSRDTASIFEVFTWAGVVENRRLCGVIEDVKDDGGYSEVIVRFCKGFILKASINPFSGGRRPYTIVPYTKVPGSPWGRGVAQKVFDMQANINRLLRMYIDNKRLSGHLMTAIDKSKLKKGETLEIYPGRNWEFEQGYQDSDVRKMIQPVTFPDVTGGVLDAINMLLVWADHASGVPRILEGAEMKGAETAYAENQRITAASKQLGLVLKNFDRYGWIPVIESFYDWNMEFLNDDRVKGDYHVIATGFASFENKNLKKLDLERMLVMGQQMPLLSARLKAAPLLEDWFQTSSLDVDRYVRSEREAQIADEQSKKEQLDQMQAQLQFAQAQKDHAHAQDIEGIRAKAEFSGAVRTQLEQMRGEMKQISDRMKIEAQKLIKAAEVELGLKKLEVQGGKTGGGTGSGRDAGYGRAPSAPPAGRGNRRSYPVQDATAMPMEMP